MFSISAFISLVGKYKLKSVSDNDALDALFMHIIKSKNVKLKDSNEPYIFSPRYASRLKNNKDELTSSLKEAVISADKDKLNYYKIFYNTLITLISEQNFILFFDDLKLSVENSKVLTKN